MRKSGSRSGDSLTLLRTVKETKEERVFVFKDGDKGIIAPADDALPESIGEFYLDEDNTIPPALAWWLTGYAKEVKDWQEYQEQTDGEETDDALVPMKAPRPAKAEAAPPTPLTDHIKWNQWGPWNNKLIFDESRKRNYTGCTCTAIAQVVYYWALKGRRRGCMGVPAYKSSMKWGGHTWKYDIPQTDPVVTFDYDRMFGIYEQSSPPSKTRQNNVAALCAHIAKALRTDFSPDASGAKTWYIKPVLEDYLKLGEVDYYYHPNDEKQTNTVLPKVREALAKGIPVIMVGCEGNSTTNCHCFVCDGYDENTGRYAINWGYSGKGNGWFTMDNLVSQTTPTSTPHNFSTNKSFYILKDVPSIQYDVNNDGKVNMSDVTEIITTHIGKKTEYSIADFNRSTGVQVRAVRADGAGATDDSVDLGLPSHTLWATCNVGASKPEDIGGYYAWGEKSTKASQSKYGWGSYEHCDGTIDTIRDIGSDISGTTYDVAKAVMGAGWAMPTREQWNELLSECTITAVEEDGQNLIRVAGKNRKFIYLPLSGCIYSGTYTSFYRNYDYEGRGAVGYYWSSSIGSDISKAKGAKIRALAFSPEYVYTGAADVNYDGKVNMDDAQAIIDYILGK